MNGAGWPLSRGWHQAIQLLWLTDDDRAPTISVDTWRGDIATRRIFTACPVCFPSQCHSTLLNATHQRDLRDLSLLVERLVLPNGEASALGLKPLPANRFRAAIGSFIACLICASGSEEEVNNGEINLDKVME